VFENIRNRRSLRLQTIMLLSATLIAGDAVYAGEKQPAASNPKPKRLTKSYFSKFFLRFTPDGSPGATVRLVRQCELVSVRKRSSVIQQHNTFITFTSRSSHPLLQSTHQNQ